VFNLWIYQRRPSCSGRIQHSGSSTFTPIEKREEAVAELLAEWIAVNAEQPVHREDNVLPFNSPRDGAPREATGRTDRKPRGRPKGR
jgi:hypothetical protein